MPKTCSNKKASKKCKSECECSDIAIIPGPFGPNGFPVYKCICLEKNNCDKK